MAKQEEKQEEKQDRSEAILIGMELGTDAYNEAIGSPLHKEDDPQGWCAYCLRDKGVGHHCCNCDE